MDMDDRIEKYILDRMTKSERIEFEREMQNNPLLKEQVDLDHAIVMRIRSQEDVDKQIKQAKEELMQEKIEAYILNLMTEIDKTEFEYDLKNNPLLKEQLELVQSLVGQIRGHAFAEKQISTAKNEMKKGKIIRMALYSVASIAASFLLFFMVHNFYQTSKFDKLYTSTYSTYPNDFIATDGSYRGDVEVDFFLLSAMTAYEMRDYPLAESQFNQHLKEKDSPEIRFYLAITQLEAGKTIEALKTLQLLYSQPIEYRYYEQTRWYLALVQLKLHEKGDAMKCLEELVALDGVYWDKAKELLKKL